MKIFDMHIHSSKGGFDADALLREMEKVGVFGGMIFSAPPKEQEIYGFGGESSFDERLRDVVSSAASAPDRLFPVLWIHPDEENIIEKLGVAARAGVVGFKMICNNYYVYEEKSMSVLREIARLGLPVVFHTGILWDGNASSCYNRPINWEPLIAIDGLRFSLGHVSWPWIDECIALYGKFLNAREGGKQVDMFFDITPGTPEIYRRELLTKLYTVGYNVGDNIMFGLDSYADSWNGRWAQKWLTVDGKILDELGVSLENREKLYEKNLMRFLGRKEGRVDIDFPRTDDAQDWYAGNPRVKEVIEAWYKRLDFPKEFDGKFYSALKKIKISDAITVEKYDAMCEDGERNLLSYLFFAEEYERKCRERGIPESVILDTLHDIVLWCISWSTVKGGLYLGELAWLNRHFSMKLFRIGRLQYCMASAECDIPKYNIKKGDNVIEIHIPAGESFSRTECERSVKAAREFFGKFYPEFEYSHFTCHSWLLDRELNEYLSENSGIRQFADMFDEVDKDVSYALIRYLFAWDTEPYNLKYRHPASSLAAAVQRDFLRGKKFYETLGVLKEIKE